MWFLNNIGVKQCLARSSVLLFGILVFGCGSSGSTNLGSFTPSLPQNSVPDSVPPPNLADIVFFRDDASPGGDGSSNSPFDSFPTALNATNPGQTLFLFAGSGNPVAFSGVIPSNVTLLGEGSGLVAEELTIPQGAFPRLQGQQTLSDGCTARGIQFENSTGTALVLISNNTATIDGNIFTNVGIHGLDLSAATGVIVVTGNQFKDDNFSNPANGILSEIRGTQNQTLTLTSNAFTTPDRTAAFDNGLRVSAQGNAQFTLTAQQNNFDVQGSGLQLQLSDSASLTGVVSQNTFLGTQLAGISVQAGLGQTDTVSSDLAVTNNTFTQTLGPALSATARGVAASQHDWRVQQNNVVAGGNFGLLLVRRDASLLRCYVSGNTISNAGQAGIQYTSGTPSGGFGIPLNGEDRITMFDNQITGSGVSGIALNLVSQTQATLLTGNNSVAPINILARATTACLGAGENTAGGFNTTVEGGFSLTFDDRGQTVPAVTFWGTGSITPGPCQP